jgi:hypothetical protein
MVDIKARLPGPQSFTQALLKHGPLLGAESQGIHHRLYAVALPSIHRVIAANM